MPMKLFWNSKIGRVHLVRQAVVKNSKGERWDVSPLIAIHGDGRWFVCNGSTSLTFRAKPDSFYLNFL